MRLLCLSAEVESRAASLCVEALQCLTVALAGTDTKNFWNVMTTFYGAESDRDEVWNFIDPASRVARPLDIESTDNETEEEEEPTGTEAVASTSQATPAKAKTPAPRSVKVQRKDVCSLEEAICVYPENEKSLHFTGIPLHLVSQRETKTSGSSGASLYHCPHPECDPVFIAKGGYATLYCHIRRHHLSMALVCPYCPNKLYYASSGWKTHMEKFHVGAPWYCQQVKPPEEQEAASLMKQLEKDPQSLGRVARCQDTVLLDSMPPKVNETALILKQEPPSIPDEDLIGEYDDDALLDEEDQEDQGDPEITEPPDIAFPPESTAERPEPPAPTHGFAYAERAPAADAFAGGSGHIIRYRSRGPNAPPVDEDDEEETAPPAKRPRPST